MRYAILSDIHHNAQALSAVLLDAARRNADEVLCLGDIGGDDCVTLVRQNCLHTVFGNGELSGWRYLSPQHQPWALALPPLVKFPNFCISHASPLWPNSIASLQQFLTHKHSFSMESAFPYYTAPSQSLWQAIAHLLETNIPLLFHGHTHQQAGWLLNGDNHLQKTIGSQMDWQAGQTAIIGVGSVGQPKNSNHPGYAMFDTQTGQIALITLA